MKWLHLLQISTLLISASLAEDEGTCSNGQECISYRECLHGKKLFGRILTYSGNDPEKPKLMEEFRSLRCGNFNNDKTVCCDVNQLQDTSYLCIKERKPTLCYRVEGVKFIGKFSYHAHGVSGDIYSIDGVDNQLHIRRFKYDGTGQNTYFMAGTEASEPNSDGFILEHPFKGKFYTSDEEHDAPVLKEFEGHEEPIVLTLPNNVKVKDLKWISVWDRTWSLSYGDMIWDDNELLQTV